MEKEDRIWCFIYVERLNLVIGGKVGFVGLGRVVVGVVKVYGEFFLSFFVFFVL